MSRRMKGAAALAFTLLAVYGLVVQRGRSAAADIPVTATLADSTRFVFSTGSAVTTWYTGATSQHQHGGSVILDQVLTDTGSSWMLYTYALKGTRFMPIGPWGTV